MELEPGANVNERVTLTEPLAAGSMGTVWLARHAGLAIDVAVKFLSGDGTPLRKAAVKRFAVEASAAAQLQSPHVVRMFDYGVTKDGTPYIVMELLHGESLAERIADGRRLDLAETVAIISQAARALDAAHGLGIFHRDIKPSNLFLTRAHDELLVKVLDFGVAKQTRSPAPGSGITEPGMIVGTPAYLCRDVLMARSSLADPLVDMWALAVAAYRCLTGKLPFDGPNIQGVAAAIVKCSPAKPSSIVPALGPEVDAWFARALAAERAQRFANAREFGDSFAALARPKKQPPEKKKGSYSALGWLIFLGGIGGAAWLYLRPPAPKPSTTPASVASHTPSATASATASAPATAASSPPPPAPPAPPSGPPQPARRGEVFVPAGTVQLDGGPRVPVDAFFVDRTEVSVLAYGKCVVAGACSDRRLQTPIELGNPDAKSGECNWQQVRREQHPMNCVSHAQAIAYCRWAGGRLPTETEWTRAARGDDTRAFPWGDELATCERAVMADTDGPGCGRRTTWLLATQPLDTSPFGAADLGGNLREWVADWFTEPTARLVKGGAWTDTSTADLSIAARRGLDPAERSIAVGFRCARSAAK
jgi:eukaryotic-like serine/threonine-protein kinase